MPTPWAVTWKTTRTSPRGGVTECKDIASQLVDWSHGNGFEVVLGGGRSNFFPEQPLPTQNTPSKNGARGDGRNLVEEWQAKYNDGAFVWNKEGFDAVDTVRRPATCFGLFERCATGRYEADRAKDSRRRAVAGRDDHQVDRHCFPRTQNGFVLMVEGGRIDHAHHAGNAASRPARTPSPCRPPCRPPTTP